MWYLYVLPYCIDNIWVTMYYTNERDLGTRLYSIVITNHDVVNNFLILQLHIINFWSYFELFFMKTIVFSHQVDVNYR